MTNDEEKHYFAKNDIFIGLNLIGPNPEILLDPSYFTLQIQQANYVNDNTINADPKNSTQIPYNYWSIDNSQYQNFLNNTTKGFKYICPKFIDFYIRSNYNSENYEIIEINLIKCTGSSWRSPEEIEEAFKSHLLQLGIVSTYFDFNNYENPIRYITYRNWNCWLLF